MNLRDAELDDALRALLNAPHHTVKIILTTRIAPRDLGFVQPGRQHRLNLDNGLELPFAKNVLTENDADGTLGLKNAGDDLLARACEFTRGFPRALEALIAILRADRYTTLAEILGVGAFEKTPSPQRAFSQTPQQENIVEALVGEAFNRLDPSAQRVMQTLAVYNRPVTPAAVDYLLQPFVPNVDSAPVLNRLVTMQFARREAGRYYLHPTDRAYAFDKVKSEKAKGKSEEADWSQKDLLNRAADYFAATRKPRETWKTLADLEPQLNEFDLRCAADDYDTAASVLLEIDGEYLLLWGHYRLMIELHEQLQGKIGDATLRQASAGDLGTAYRSIGQAKSAIACYEKVLDFTHESKNRQHEGAALGNLGNAYSDLGETRRAIQFYEQALAIAREIGDRRNEGNWLGGLGNAYSALGETRRAIAFYEQALAIDRDAERGDKRGEGADLGNLGNAYSALGETRRAIQFYEQALAIARDAERGDRRGEGADLGNLGGAYSDLGETRRAIQFYEQALAIAREIGDRRGESFDLNNRADVLIDEKRFDEAIESYKQAIQIADEIGLTTIQNYARWGTALAHLYAAQINPKGLRDPSGLEAARAAAESARQYDVPQNNHNVAALLGIIALRHAAQSAGAADVVAARAAFTAAIAHADALLAQTPELYDALDAKGIALCGLALHNGLDRIERTNQAVETFRAARAINKDAGIVARVVRLLDALALVHPNGKEILAEARKAASGE
ncbi:MAG: tetratricopeptide repeat protein [Chloroflexi bacterium]|nr:tetratricopeptide repeat protein [Chloroflexota bacterium]